MYIYIYYYIYIYIFPRAHDAEGSAGSAHNYSLGSANGCSISGRTSEPDMDILGNSINIRSHRRAQQGGSWKRCHTWVARLV